MRILHAEGVKFPLIILGQIAFVATCPIVEKSREPELDAARALLAQGINGKLTMCDGKTGKPRTIIDIEKAANLTVKEGPLRFVEQSRPNSPYSPETHLEVA